MKFIVKSEKIGNAVKGDQIMGQIIYKENPNRGQSSHPSTSDCFVVYFAGGHWNIAMISSFEI